MAEYRVQLDLFSGPMDLLLHLVRRSELDVTRLSLARIADQYQQFLNALKFLELDCIGDFLVLASSLMELKSREVLPQPESATGESDDAPDPNAGDLIARLLEHKRYKDAAADLEQRAAQWRERFPRLHDDRPATQKDHSADTIREVELWDLVSALARVLEQKEVDESRSIRYDDTPISVYVEQIAARICDEKFVAFSTLFSGTNQRSKIIGLFLAVLELIRHHGFRAEQPVDYGEIFIHPPVNAAVSSAATC